MPPGQLERRHVERDDVRHADHGAGDREAHHGQELERAAAGEAVARDHVGGEQPDDRGERRRHRGDLDRS